MPNVRKDPSPTKGTGLPAVTPLEVDRVRRSVLDVVRKQMPEVREVLAGNKRWDAQQTRLFGMMLNKVMPDLHHSFNEHTIENKEAHELTIEELQTIAAQAKAVEAEYEEVDNVTNTTGSSQEVAHNSSSEG
tara:strand:- start:190 stop:585 length:396 start_codon:yes stop_codon:yes gene_type:complete